MTGWLLTFEEPNGARTVLGRVRTWEAGADALYRLCDRWSFNNRGAAGDPHIRNWADRQRSYLASAILTGRCKRPRAGFHLRDCERGITVRLERA